MVEYIKEGFEIDPFYIGFDDEKTEESTKRIQDFVELKRVQTTTFLKNLDNYKHENNFRFFDLS